MYIWILFSISLSVDAAAVGFCYGIKKIIIPPLALFIIGSVCAVLSGGGIFFGEKLSALFSPSLSRYIGFISLSLLALHMILDTFRKKRTHHNNSLNMLMDSLDYNVQIIKSPINCDFDNSHTLDFIESLHLSILLSADALFCCIGLSMEKSLSVFMPFLLGFAQVAFLCAGNFMGKHFSKNRFFESKIAAFLPGAILFAAAFLQFII